MIEGMETVQQLASWGWGLGFITGALVVTLWDITDDDDRHI